MTVKVCALGDFFLAPELFPEILKRYCGDEIEFAVHKMPPGPMISGEHGDAIREYSGNEDQVIEWAKDADAVLVHIAPVSRRVIDALPNLKFIGVGRGGPVNVDQAAAAERNIVLANAPGRNAGAVAEFTVGAIISTSREIAMGTMEMKANEWSRVHYHYENTGLELSEMTIGLIGYAHIGRIVGRLLCAFGDFFSKLKPGCILINTARGELVDQKALLEHLISGSVGAAFLDTFNPEPPQSDDPLIHHPKVFTTPHIAGASKTSAHIAVNVISKALSEWINDNR